MPVRLISWAVIAAEVLLVVIVAFEATRRAPINHVGYDIRWLYALPLLHVLFVVAEKMTKHAVQPLKLLPALVLVLLIWSFDHFNILVQYDRWTKRGMPERGDVTPPRN